MRLSADELRAAHDDAEAILTGQLEQELPVHDDVAAVDRYDPSAPRGRRERKWFVRMTGADKDFTTVWFTLDERTVRHETGFMPYPEENQLELYRYLLKLNLSLVGVQFAIGDDEGIFLVGALPVETVTAREIDRIVGTIYATVERHWRTAMRIAFASRFRE